MGGSGSGQHWWHFGAKDTTDDYRTLDVRRWQRDGLLAWFRQVIGKYPPLVKQHSLLRRWAVAL